MTTSEPFIAYFYTFSLVKSKLVATAVAANLLLLKHQKIRCVCNTQNLMFRSHEDPLSPLQHADKHVSPYRQLQPASVN